MESPDRRVPHPLSVCVQDSNRVWLVGLVWVWTGQRGGEREREKKGAGGAER